MDRKRSGEEERVEERSLRRKGKGVVYQGDRYDSR